MILCQYKDIALTATPEGEYQIDTYRFAKKADALQCFKALAVKRIEAEIRENLLSYLDDRRFVLPVKGKATRIVLEKPTYKWVFHTRKTQYCCMGIDGDTIHVFDSVASLKESGLKHFRKEEFRTRYQLSYREATALIEQKREEFYQDTGEGIDDRFI